MHSLLVYICRYKEPIAYVYYPTHGYTNLSFKKQLQLKEMLWSKTNNSCPARLSTQALLMSLVCGLEDRGGGLLDDNKERLIAEEKIPNHQFQPCFDQDNGCLIFSLDSISTHNKDNISCCSIDIDIGIFSNQVFRVLTLADYNQLPTQRTKPQRRHDPLISKLINKDNFCIEELEQISQDIIALPDSILYEAVQENREDKMEHVFCKIIPDHLK